MSAYHTTALTRQDIIEACLKTSPESYAYCEHVTPFRDTLSHELRGKTFDITLECGRKLKYVFEKNSVIWSEDNGEAYEEACEVLKLNDRKVYLVHHLRTHVLPYEAMTLVLDLENELATLVYDRIGKISATRDINRIVAVGYIGAEKEITQKQTDDLTCKTIDWKYGEDAIIHTSYVNCECLAFTSPAPANLPGWTDYFSSFNPTKYYRLDKDIYLISFYAPYTSGMEVTMLADLKKMTAACASFGFDSEDRFRSCTFSAKGAYASFGFIGRFTVD